ncbi:MAG: hypothetical protein WC389_10960 [Lutibacter sp.]|jgi:Mn-containing catalase
MAKTQVEIADMIMKAINALSIEGHRSEELIKAKAESARDYDKYISIATAELKAKGEPITIIDKIAKGNCSEVLYKKILAEEMLKAHYSKIERLEAQMNGLQSMNRYLTSTTRMEIL